MKLKVEYSSSNITEMISFLIQRDYDEDILDYMDLFTRCFSELDYFNENLLEWYARIKEYFYVYKDDTERVKQSKDRDCYEIYDDILDKYLCKNTIYFDIYKTELFKELLKLKELARNNSDSVIIIRKSIDIFNKIFENIDNILLKLEKNNGGKIFRYIGFNEHIEYRDTIYISNELNEYKLIIEEHINKMIGRDGTKLLNVSNDGKVYYYKVAKRNK